MTGLTNVLAGEVVAAYDFSRFRRVVDVGGGRGTLLQAILHGNDHATGILFDLPRVIADAAGLKLGPRIELISGDFFMEVPAGGDAYLMKWILHDWDDAECDRILASCRRAITPQGKLIVIESVVPPPGVPHHSKLARSGFRLSRIVPTPSDLVSVIEAEPIANATKPL